MATAQTLEFEYVLDQQYSRYINLREELEAYLTEKYGEGKDFKVLVCQRLLALDDILTLQ